MGQKKIIICCIMLLIIIVLLCNLGIDGILGQEPNQGMCTIAGRVYNSDGENPGEGYEGTFATVIIEHDGERETYIDSSGLELDTQGNYWYVVNIPEEGWAIGDTFWVHVDGTVWGDINYDCVDHDDTAVRGWIIDSAVMQQDVNTVDEVPRGDDYLSSPFFYMGVIIFIVIFTLMLIFFKSNRTGESTKISQSYYIQQPYLCPTCGEPLEYIHVYQRHFCNTCQRYY